MALVKCECCYVFPVFDFQVWTSFLDWRGSFWRFSLAGEFGVWQVCVEVFSVCIGFRAEGCFEVSKCSVICRFAVGLRCYYDIRPRGEVFCRFGFEGG